MRNNTIHRKLLIPLTVLIVILALPSSALLPSVFSTPTVLYVAPSPPALAGSGTSGGSCSAPGFNTISAAINYATPSYPGATIYVCTGTYTEQVTVSEPLTLTGVRYPTKTSALPTIQPPSPMTPDTYGAMNIVTITGATTIATFTDFIVTGPAPLTGPGPTGCAGAYFIGVFVENGATATIANDFISHIRNNVPNDCARAIVVGHDAQLDGATFTTTGTATITDTTINDYWKSGIDIDQTGSKATIYDNTIEGMGPTTAIAQNGIEILAGATATVKLNTITGNECNDVVDGCGSNLLSNTQADGILLFCFDPAACAASTISHNTLSKNDIGIELYTAASSNIVTSNTCNGNRYAGIALEDGTYTVSSNSVTGPGNVGIAAVADAANTAVTLSGNTIKGVTASIGAYAGPTFTATIASS